MQKILFIVLLISLCVSSVCGQTEVTKDEYDVYASVLKVIYKKSRETFSNKSDFAILQNTKIDDDLDLPETRKFKSLVSDFNTKNQTETVLERRFPFNLTYFLITQNELDKLFELGRAEYEKTRKENELNNKIVIELGNSVWMPFFRKYPDANGYYTLSRVGFNGNKDFALVQVIWKHFFTGFSRTYILRKIKGDWQIFSLSGSGWIS